MDPPPRGIKKCAKICIGSKLYPCILDDASGLVVRYMLSTDGVGVTSWMVSKSTGFSSLDSERILQALVGRGMAVSPAPSVFTLSSAILVHPRSPPIAATKLRRRQALCGGISDIEKFIKETMLLEKRVQQKKPRKPHSQSHKRHDAIRALRRRAARNAISRRAIVNKDFISYVCSVNFAINCRHAR